MNNWILSTKLQAREVFTYLKELIFYCKQWDPKTILKTVNPREVTEMTTSVK